MAGLAAETWRRLVAQKVDGGASWLEATRQVAKEHPDVRQAMIEEVNRQRAEALR